MKSIFIIILMLASSHLMSQVEPIQDEKKLNQFEPRFDFRFNAGLSLPLGKYKMPTPESDDRSSAGLGGYGELMTSITPLPNSPWRIAATLGYMYHPFESKRSKDLFNLPVMEGSDWHSFYTLVGVGYISRTKFVYGTDLGVGLMGFQGGNITSGSITNDTMEVRSWAYNMHLGLALKISIVAGYQISPKFSLFVTASIFYAAAARKGGLVSEYFLTDAQGQKTGNSVEDLYKSVENQTTVFALNLGIGFRYKFYSEPDNFNYKFNIEENK